MIRSRGEQYIVEVCELIDGNPVFKQSTSNSERDLNAVVNVDQHRSNSAMKLEHRIVNNTVNRNCVPRARRTQTPLQALLRGRTGILHSNIFFELIHY